MNEQTPSKPTALSETNELWLFPLVKLYKIKLEQGIKDEVRYRKEKQSYKSSCLCFP